MAEKNRQTGVPTPGELVEKGARVIGGRVDSPASPKAPSGLSGANGAPGYSDPSAGALDSNDMKK